MKVLETRYETLDLGAPAPGVVVVTLNRPDRYNAMTATMFDELERAAIALDDEDDLRAIPGRGIFEFALTRSPAYTYEPTVP